MEIITSLDEINLGSCKSGVALGTFDGVHIGHQTLLINLVDMCRRNHLNSIVYTFRNHPRSLTSVKGAPEKIMSGKSKLQMFRELGIDYVVSVAFDDYQRSLHPEQFIKEILIEKLHMAYGVVGFDYRFGYKAQGDVNVLRQFRHKYGYELMSIGAIKIEEEVISSTAIRKFIREGNMDKANLFLGRKFSLEGIVVKGKELGHKLGFPTANISIKENLVLPKPGVYYTKCIIDHKIYYSITNVGYNPTFGENPITVETHVLHFHGDLYGKKIEVQFYHRCREEIKFSTIDGLIMQVQRDIQSAKRFFNI
ncbi:bifunctional riboflavin kinase/FAD synthetase [Thermotalea metallivorans]|uniref:Riboflavin biosynthesis protein n=1 Tax=Thermotalea metallivorans TaxID=520762 RepID=A0A140L5H4_9FIRM|nr:bifunctional riboflavin kinase/FAD synthetase [Thermotalea metallivorans]KXG75799.1 Riboflavin biosynthesis protein RibF [Thermotalea metallivorans]